MKVVSACQPLIRFSGLFDRKVISHQGKGFDFGLYFANTIKVGLGQFNRGNFALAQQLSRLMNTQCM